MTVIDQKIADHCWCSADCSHHLEEHTLDCQHNLRALAGAALAGNSLRSQPESARETAADSQTGPLKSGGVTPPDTDRRILSWPVLIAEVKMAPGSFLPDGFGDVDPTATLRAIGTELRCEFLGFELSDGKVIDLTYRHVRLGRSLPGNIRVTFELVTDLPTLRHYVSVQLAFRIKQAEEKIAKP